MNLIPRKKLKYLLYLFDTFAVSLALLIAYILRNNVYSVFLGRIQPLDIYLKTLPIAVITLIISLWSVSLYKLSTRSKTTLELFYIIKGVFVWSLVVMSLAYLSKYDYSRLTMLLTLFLNLFFVITFRMIYRRIELESYRKGIGQIKTLIIGAGRPGRKLARKLISFEKIGYELVGFIDDNARSRENFPVIGKIKDLSNIINKHNINEIYITNPRLSYEETLSLVYNNLGKNISFKIANNLFDKIRPSNGQYGIDQIPSLDVWKSETGRFYKVLKRLSDIFFSSLGLILTTPIWILIYIIIHLDDGEPVLINLERVGQNGHIFKMYKFRSMRKNTSKQSSAPKTENDNRITRVGIFLRRNSLDELPQLINILRGEMSLVGPRPEMPHIVKDYSDWERLRLTAKPGLTGLWQILGRKDLPLHENIEYDFYYINNQGLVLDITILIKTIPAVLLGRGAY